MAKYLDEAGIAYFWKKCRETFVAKKEFDKSKITQSQSCPHCGAPFGKTDICEYCGSHIGFAKFIYGLDNGMVDNEEQKHQ